MKRLLSGNSTWRIPKLWRFKGFKRTNSGFENLIQQLHQIRKRLNIEYPKFQLR